MTEQRTSNEHVPSAEVSNLNLSNVKDKLAEAINLCNGDFDCLVKLNQVLSEATDLCVGAMAQVSPGDSGQQWAEGEEKANTGN